MMLNSNEFAIKHFLKTSQHRYKQTSLKTHMLNEA